MNLICLQRDLAKPPSPKRNLSLKEGILQNRMNVWMNNLRDRCSIVDFVQSALKAGMQEKAQKNNQYATLSALETEALIFIVSQRWWEIHNEVKSVLKWIWKTFFLKRTISVTLRFISKTQNRDWLIRSSTTLSARGDCPTKPNQDCEEPHDGLVHQLYSMSSGYIDSNIHNATCGHFPPINFAKVRLHGATSAFVHKILNCYYKKRMIQAGGTVVKEKRRMEAAISRMRAAQHQNKFGKFAAAPSMQFLGSSSKQGGSQQHFHSNDPGTTHNYYMRGAWLPIALQYS